MREAFQADTLSHLLSACHQQVPSCLISEVSFKSELQLYCFLPSVTTPESTVIGHQLLKGSIFEEQLLRLEQNTETSWAKELNAARQADRWQLTSRQAPWGLSLPNSLPLQFDVSQQLREINSKKLNLLQGHMTRMKSIVLGAISHLKLSDLRGREAAPFLCKAPLVGCIIGIC